MNNHKHYRKMMSDSLREIKESGDQQPLNKAPVEYSPHEGDETPTRPIQTPSQKWTQIHEQELPNGLVYKQYKQSHRDYESPEEDVEFQHHLVDPSTGKSVSILRTTAFLPRNPDYSMPHEHTITWAQTDPSQKGKGLGKQAYLATLIHGYGVGRLNSDTLLSQSGHKAWSSLKNVPGIKVNLAPYATDQDFEMSREFYDKAEKKYHTMRVHNKDELDHNKMFPSVDLSAKEEKLAASEKIVGGKGDRKKDSQFSPKEIKMGHKVEMEHTSSPRIAAEITRDHLTENPKYYSKLKQAGLADELKKGKIGPECKTKLKAYSRRKGWQYPSAVVHLQAGKICGSKTKSEDLENNLRKDLRRWVKEKWANPKGETHHGSGKTGWRPTVRVSGKTPQTWGEMTPHQKKKKVQNKKKANKRGGGWSTHESGKKQVWNTKKSDLLEKIEFLEKAEPPPTLIGQISPDGRKKAIGIPGGEIVWDVHPRLKREIDTRIIQKARDWLKTQPAEHHPILKQFINEIISDPYRHVRYGSNKKNGPIMPRLRHVEAMVTNHPEAKLIVHSPESMSLYVGRHGEWKGISHFKHELKKGLVKSENLFYNGLNGSYTDEFGNTYKFSDGNGHELSKSERDALGTEDGLLRQFRRLAKTDEATIRRISLFLRHGGVRGNAGSGRNEEGHGAPHGDGALLSMMNDAVFDDPWDQAKHDREHLDNDDNGNGGEIVFDDPWDQAKHDREHLDSDSLDLNKAEESDNPIFSRAAWRDEKSQIGLPQLYRHYKNSPHHPVSLALKYLVHRIENEDKYNTASQESKNQMDSDFLQFHQAGGAKHKNGDVTVKHLNDFYDNHAQKLIPQLLDHKRKLHNSIVYNFPDAIKDIDGQPHIALTRGLDTEQPGKDHALSSYADAASTGFGIHMHHRWVPLNNLWFSYETGPKKATSEKFGNEREYLVSPHEIKPAKENDVKPIFGRSGQFHDFNFEPLEKLQDGMVDHNDPIVDLLESHAHRIHPKMLDRIVDRLGVSAAEAISRNNYIDHQTTQRILSFNHPRINARLASNPNLHPSLHEKLANDEDWDVRRALASNPNLHPSLHEKLANDKNPYVRLRLAGNSSLHPSLHEKLANDEDPHVRQALASNQNLHPSLHEKLANDKDWNVRRAMTSNANYGGGIKKSENTKNQLKKGARGDWKKEKYVLRYHAPKGEGAYGLHTVTAHNSNGNVVGELSAEDLNDGTFQANIVEVHPEHRRKGIAGAMYNHMETKTGLRAVPDLEAQTPEGAALWRQKNRPFGKSEQIYNSLQKASASKKLLGMLGLVAATSLPITQPKQTFSPKNDYSTSQTIQKDVDLRSIADTESGNKDKASHETVMTGLNAGSSAIGRYGMMPLTVKDLVAKKSSLNKYKNVLKYSDSQLADFMHKNPQFQKEVASVHYDRLSNIFNGNLAHIAHAWLNGVQGTKNAIKAGKNIISHWHVQKVINARNKILGIKAEDKKQKVNKKPKKVQMPKSSKIIIP